MATGDDKALDNYLRRSKGVIRSEKIVKFPSRININIFRPKNFKESRKILDLDLSKIYVVTTGRLSQLKGWKFMLDCFVEFKKFKSNSHFIFIGDGEDKEKIVDYLRSKGITNNVDITGVKSHQEISNYLNASNIFIMGSYVEGWSTALVEAISCAKPVICTNFSSAEELIENGLNGFVIENRNQNKFVAAMLNSLDFTKKNLLEKAHEMEKYSTKSLRSDILKHWSLI